MQIFGFPYHQKIGHGSREDDTTLIILMRLAHPLKYRHRPTNVGQWRAVSCSQNYRKLARLVHPFEHRMLQVLPTASLSPPLPCTRDRRTRLSQRAPVRYCRVRRR